MFVRVFSVANSGLEAIEITVEINITKGKTPTFTVVGLPAKTVSESRDRVRAGITNSKLHFPLQRIIVNLAPADIPKEGSCYDLPIAVGVLSFSLNIVIPEKSLFFGEMSLDGSLKHTKGALLLALFAKENGFKNVFLPQESANEAAVVKGVDVYPVKNIKEMVDFLLEQKSIQRAVYRRGKQEHFSFFDMKEVLGQETAKRALEIAASGGHNIFMMGSPGSGKTMLSRAFSGILPALTEEESLEVTKIYSISGFIPPKGGLMQVRPFRAPHHSISTAGLIGGGSVPKPGEVTLAHRGVLFLDEFNEFQRSSLEALRQPIEDGYISISRSRERVVFPSRHILIASANPCPCGYYNHQEKECNCTQREIERYKKKVSGPILDRIDMHIDVPDVKTEKLSFSSDYVRGVEESFRVRKRVEKARKVQKERFLNEDIFTNAEMRNREMKKYAKISKGAEKLLINAARALLLSARSYYKTVKLARTVADLEGEEEILVNHIKEALQYRRDEEK